jgi:lysophospholipase L1-like esterase
MIGTNDLKMCFSLSAFDIANGAGVLVDIVQCSEAGPEGGAPRVLLIAPPPLGKLTDFADMFTGGEAKSRKFSEQYRRVADEHGCALMDVSQVIASSDIDGVHLELSEHRKLGEAAALLVRDILEN